MKAQAEWTAPYHGVSHLGEIAEPRRVSVIDHDTFCLLHKWYPGCGFSPIEETHDNVKDAKAAGEKWLQSGGSA
jgi:hypothetical protein